MISNRIRDLYRRADRVSGNRLDIVKDAISTFVITRASQASASIAYYVIFSLFPMLLLLISVGSFFLDSEQVYLKVTQLVQQNIPATSYDWIVENLQQVIRQRGAISIISLATLLWATSGGFISLAYNISLAWLEAPQRSFLQKRLIGFQMIAGISGLFFLSLVIDTIPPPRRARLGSQIMSVCGAPRMGRRLPDPSCSLPFVVALSVCQRAARPDPSR